MRLLLTLMIIISLIIPANAERPHEAWVMCQLNSEVVVRAKPSKHAREVARVYPGDRVELDGKKIGRWYHCIGTGEPGEGWIRGDYLSFTEPVVYKEGKLYHTTKANLIARFSIRGNVRRKFRKKGVTVTVYLMAEEWAVTSQGFIMTRFLEAEDEEELLELQGRQETRIFNDLLHVLRDRYQRELRSLLSA